MQTLVSWGDQSQSQEARRALDRIAKVGDPTRRSARLSVLPHQATKPFVGFLLKNVLLPIRQHSSWASPVLGTSMHRHADDWNLPQTSPDSPRIVGSATSPIFNQFTHARMRGTSPVVVGNSTSQLVSGSLAAKPWGQSRPQPPGSILIRTAPR